MKILILTNRFTPDTFAGAEWSIYNIAKSMIDLGCEINVVTCGDKKDFNYQGINILFVPTFDNNRLIDVLKNIEFDIMQLHILTYGFGYRVIKTVKKKFNKCPIVITFHDQTALCLGALRCVKKFDQSYKMPTVIECLYCQKIKMSPIQRYHTINLINKYSDYIVFVSKDIEKFFRENGITVEGHVLYNGTLPSVIKSLPEQDVKEYYYKNKLPYRKLIVCGGRMTPRKGYHIPLEAFVKLSNELQGFSLLIYGNKNSYMEKLRNSVSEKSISNVIFKNWLTQKELRLIYNGAYLGVVPSMYPDPLPRSVYDMISTGLLTISTNYGGAKEIIVHNETGFLYDPFNADELFELLKKMCIDKDLRDKVAVRSRLYLIEHKEFYSTENGKRRLNVYKKLIDKYGK